MSVVDGFKRRGKFSPKGYTLKELHQMIEAQRESVPWRPGQAKAKAKRSRGMMED